MIKIKGVKPLRLIRIEGIVLYPFVLFASKIPHGFLENHERIHCDQIKRDGVFRFYGSYLFQYFNNRRKGMNKDQAYRAISYEKEAYQHHHESQYKIAHHKN